MARMAMPMSRVRPTTRMICRSTSRREVTTRMAATVRPSTVRG